jgi:hypothetical protein
VNDAKTSSHCLLAQHRHETDAAEQMARTRSDPAQPKLSGGLTEVVRSTIGAVEPITRAGSNNWSSEREALVVVDPPDNRLPLWMGVVDDDAAALGFSHDVAPRSLRDRLGVSARLAPSTRFTSRNIVVVFARSAPRIDVVVHIDVVMHKDFDRLVTRDDTEHFTKILDHWQVPFPVATLT